MYFLSQILNVTVLLFIKRTMCPDTCGNTCQGWENRDVTLTAYQYDLWAAAAELSPPDQVEVFRLVTGKTVSEETAHDELVRLAFRHDMELPPKQQAAALQELTGRNVDPRYASYQLGEEEKKFLQSLTYQLPGNSQGITPLPRDWRHQGVSEVMILDPDQNYTLTPEDGMLTIKGGTYIGELGQWEGKTIALYRSPRTYIMVSGDVDINAEVRAGRETPMSRTQVEQTIADALAAGKTVTGDYIIASYMNEEWERMKKADLVIL